MSKNSSWKSRLAVGLALAVLHGCSGGERSEREKEAQQWQQLKGVQFYWEDERPGMLERFSNALRRMGEEPFWNISPDQLPQHYYRFVLLPSFEQPVVVVITPTTDGRWAVRSKIFEGQNGGVGHLLRAHATTNAAPEVALLVAELDRWIHAVPEYDGQLGVDGTRWLIEGLKNGRHFSVHTWSPQAGWIREMGLRFLSLAGIDEERVH